MLLRLPAGSSHSKSKIKHPESFFCTARAAGQSDVKEPTKRRRPYFSWASLSPRFDSGLGEAALPPTAGGESSSSSSSSSSLRSSMLDVQCSMFKALSTSPAGGYSSCSLPPRSSTAMRRKNGSGEPPAPTLSNPSSQLRTPLRPLRLGGSNLFPSAPHPLRPGGLAPPTSLVRQRNCSFSKIKLACRHESNPRNHHASHHFILSWHACLAENPTQLASR